MSPGTKASILYPPGRRARFQLDWTPGRMKPGLNADVLSATESERTIADEDIEITGSNVLRTDTLHDISGAVRMLNATGGATDSVILGGHEDANQSSWGHVTWGTDQETEFECLMTLGPAALLVDSVYFVGLKLTNAHAVATDNDSAFFFIDDDGTGGGAWQASVSVGGIDEIVDTAVVTGISTMHHFRVAFDKNEMCRMYLNDQLVVAHSFRGNPADLKPFVGVVEDTSATIPRNFVHRMVISRALDT